MDEAKMQLLFGSSLASSDDPDDPDVLSALLEAAAQDDLSPGGLVVREVLANQIRDENPPEVWATAQRLLGLGVDREDVIGQLSFALATFLTTAMAGNHPPDLSAYSATLAQLPVPTAAEIEATLVAAVRQHPGIRADEADRAVLTALGRDDGAGFYVIWSIG